MHRLTLIAAIAVVSAPAAAAPVSMTCENPRQSYLVEFDRDARTFIINPDTDRSEYTVLAVEADTVAGAVGHDSGLAFLASLSPPKQIAFYDGATVIQTDPCE